MMGEGIDKANALISNSSTASQVTGILAGFSFSSILVLFGERERFYELNISLGRHSIPIFLIISFLISVAAIFFLFASILLYNASGRAAEYITSDPNEEKLQEASRWTEQAAWLNAIGVSFLILVTVLICFILHLLVGLGALILVSIVLAYLFDKKGGASSDR